MKKKKEVIDVSAKAKQAIRSYLSLSEKLKGSYFFKPPSNAGSRRSYEKSNSFAYKDDMFDLSISVQCSAKNVYVYKSIYINGVKKTAAALKKFV